MNKIYTLFRHKSLVSGLLIASSVFFSFKLLAQTAPPIKWNKTYGGNGYENLFTLKQTQNGGYIMGGFSNSGISGDKSQASRGNRDYWIINLDGNGNKIWDKTFGGNEDDIVYSLQQTSDGGFILGGGSNSGISGDKSESNRGMTWTYDVWVIKIDASGNKIWDKTFGGSSDDGLVALQQTSDGGYILGCSSNSSISGDKTQASKGGADFWILKLDSNGNKVWDKTIGGNLNDALWALQQTTDGGYIVGGFSESDISGDKSENRKGDSDFWVAKLDANGNKMWDKTIGGNQEDILYSLSQTTDGGYILAGTSKSDISGNKSEANKGTGPFVTNDYWIVKIDTNGNFLWDKTIGGNQDDDLYSVRQTADGGFILGGNSVSDISGDKSENSQIIDYWIVKLDNTGSKLWDKTVGGSSYDYLWVIDQTSDNGFILGGESNSGISGDKTQASQGGYDFWIVKLGPEVTGINEKNTISSVSVSPNPGKGKFRLNVENVASAAAEVTVTDLPGRVVIHKNLKVTDGNISEEFTLHAASGMYMLKIKAGNQSATRKIIVE